MSRYSDCRKVVGYFSSDTWKLSAYIITDWKTAIFQISFQIFLLMVPYSHHLNLTDFEVGVLCGCAHFLYILFPSFRIASLRFILNIGYWRVILSDIKAFLKRMVLYRISCKRAMKTLHIMQKSRESDCIRANSLLCDFLFWLLFHIV